MLALVPVVLVDRAVPVAAARVRQVPPDRSLEERFATFACELAVVLAGALVAADDTFDVLVFEVLLASVLGVHALGGGALLERQELLLLDGRAVLGHGQAERVVLGSAGSGTGRGYEIFLVHRGGRVGLHRGDRGGRSGSSAQGRNVLAGAGHGQVRPERGRIPPGTVRWRRNQSHPPGEAQLQRANLGTLSARVVEPGRRRGRRAQDTASVHAKRVVGNNIATGFGPTIGAYAIEENFS